MLGVLLLANQAQAVVVLNPPQFVPTINNSLRIFQPTKSEYSPDGKLVMFRENLTDPNSHFIFSLPLDFRMRSPTNNFSDPNIVPAPGNAADYPNHLPLVDDINYVELPNTVPIPPASDTGARDPGSHYDDNRNWLSNAFRLSETSQPSAPSSHMIAFVHEEDWYGYGYPVDCAFKNVGVRYSTDLGKSWTRAVPILTKIRQKPWSECETWPRAGVGDGSAMWNPINQTWHIFAQEDPMKPDASPPLVMAVSNDTLGRPYSWTRVDPVSGQTQPGFIGLNATIAHGDLADIKGASPSIMRDEKNHIWHMVYAQWGGGLIYTNSTNLWRWTPPFRLAINYTQFVHTVYPSLIGDQSDVLTTNGKATLYFGANKGDLNIWGKAYFSVGIDFNSWPSGSQVQQESPQHGVAFEQSDTRNSHSQSSIFEDL